MVLLPASPLAILQIQLIRSGVVDEYPLTQPSISIGREKDNDVILDDTQVSRHHLRIDLASTGPRVTDLGSVNGVKLRGQSIPPRTPTPFAYGEAMELQEFRLTLKAAAGLELATVVDAGNLQAPPPPELVVNVLGKESRRPVDKSTLTIGRLADNDIVIESPLVSRHHAQITQDAQGLLITDLGSANGILVRGLKVQQARLLPGEIIQIGGEAVSLKIEAAPAPQQTVAAAQPPAANQRIRVGLAQQQPPVLVLTVDGQVTTIPLTKPRLTLGRQEDCDIVIDHRLISRRHAQIDLTPQGVTITDLGSTNGLLYGGQRVQQCQLGNGEILLLGGDAVALQFSTGQSFIQPVAQIPQQAPENVTVWRPRAPQAAPAGAPQDTAYLNLKGMETITIGRSPENRIVLNNPQVSLQHAQIERMGGRYLVRDLRSATGVIVNGVKIEKEAWIKEGDEIRIAGFKMVLREAGIQQVSEEGLRLDAVGLNKWVRKDKNLLQNISLSILPQEFVALVGMSGSGKSTLMDAINGFRPATHGMVYVNGTNLYKYFDLFRNEMGYVPQKDIVHQELTVYGALDYSAQLRMAPDTSRSERHQRITEVLHDLDLTERKDLPIHKLSGGQLKRVSIGVELLTKPRLFFLDEPTSGLDPGTEAEMMRLLRKLADQGRTIMLITHATKNVMMCDKVIFLARGGYMAFYGPPEEALPYFDTYRTEKERLQKDMEFDDIYKILNDDSRGSGKEWNKRYLGSSAYNQYVVARLQSQGLTAGVVEAPARHSEAVASLKKRKRSQVGTLRQFFVLSARNLKIMTQDRFGLALMLALAPLIGMMDFMWGNKLFDKTEGDATKIITMLFMTGLISVLVGAMASVREIVKEVDIYKRERAINLKLTSYILSKVWVGVVLSLYQATVLLAFQWAFNLRTSPLDLTAYGFMLTTIFLGTLSGYLMGLCISAAAPNQNVALLLVIVILVPQFLFSGALLALNMIPGGPVISGAVSTRWGFEAMVNLTGMGKDIVQDPCWRRVIDENVQPNDITTAEKEDQVCNCMGKAMFESCYFPGILNPNFYTEAAQEALASEKPVEPLKPTAYPSYTPLSSLTPYASLTPLPSLTPRPSLTTWPSLTPVYTFTPPPTPKSQSGQSDYQSTREQQGKIIEQTRLAQGKVYEDLRSTQGKIYENTRSAQGEEYKNKSLDQGKVYENMRVQQGDQYKDLSLSQGSQYEKAREGQGDQYASAMKTFGDDLKDWQSNTEKAINASENTIKSILDKWGQAFEGGIYDRWISMGIIMLVIFGLLIFFQKRKDTV